jgi:hypothetical protein
LAAAQTPFGSSVIDGVVTDTNLVGVARATVSVSGTPLRVATGTNGGFRILGLSADQYVITVRRIGYEPLSTAVRLVERDTIRLSLTMRPVPTLLDTFTIAAGHFDSRLEEFEDRRRLGFGYFITQADLEKRNSPFVGDVLRTVLSVNIVERGRLQVATSLRSGGYCPFQVRLDGMLLLPTPYNLADLPSTREIAGIEVYPGAATIPLRYKSPNSGCGLILVWTKNR